MKERRNYGEDGCKDKEGGVEGEKERVKRKIHVRDLRHCVCMGGQGLSLIYEGICREAPRCYAGADPSALVMELEGGCSELQKVQQTHWALSPKGSFCSSEQFPSEFPQTGNYFSEDALSAGGAA